MKDVDHWKKNYESARKFSSPSQFAAFTLNEISGITSIIEFGSGDGRDTNFFSNQGLEVFASDGSETAVGICNKIPPGNGKIVCEVVDYSQLDQISSWLKKAKFDFSSSVIYARFLFHSVDSKTEDNLLDIFLQLFNRGTKNAYLEFRTEFDAHLPKVTASHFRRFINLQEFENKLLGFGFEIVYKAVGQGFAKYGIDDAHVARYIIKNGNQ